MGMSGIYFLTSLYTEVYDFIVKIFRENENCPIGKIKGADEDLSNSMLRDHYNYE